MKILLQLRDLLLRNGIKPKALRENRAYLGKADENDSLLERAVAVLWEKPEGDEDHLAQTLYGPEADRSTNSYKKLKQRLVDEVTNEIISLGLNSRQFTGAQKGHYAAHREYIIGHILAKRGVKHAAIYFYRRALSKAEKYGAYNISMLALAGLRDHASIADKDANAFERYDLQYKRSIEVVVANSEVSGYYCRLTMIYDGSPGTMHKIHEQASGFLETLDKKYAPYQYGHHFTYQYFLIKILFHYSIGEYQEAAEVSSTAIDYFRKTPVKYHQWIVNFHLHHLVFYTLLEHYDLGELSYRRAMQIVTPGPGLWMRLQEGAFRLYCYRRRYELAWEIYNAIVTKRWFSGISIRHQERWLLNQAYLHYLALRGVTDNVLDKSFRLAKFINSLHNVSKQKEGGNITVIIIHTLFLIHRGKHQEAGEQIDKSEKYLTRYLRRGENYRSKCFLKILQQFAKVGFDPKRGQLSTRSWYDKMLTTPLSSPGLSYEVEVIPYEDLYAILLDLPLPFRKEH